MTANNDYIEILDLLLARYDMTYFNTLKLKTGIRLIVKIYKERHEKRLWDMWLAKYQWMDEENYTSFEDLKSSATVKRQKKFTKEEKKNLLELSERIKQRVQNKQFI